MRGHKTWPAVFLGGGHRELPKPASVDAHPDGSTSAGVLDLWGNLFEWTSEFRDEHSAKAVVRGGHFWRGVSVQHKACAVLCLPARFLPCPCPCPCRTVGCLRSQPQEGTRWYFPRPADLYEHNTFLLLSDSMDRSAGIGFRCAANFASAA